MGSNRKKLPNSSTIPDNRVSRRTFLGTTALALRLGADVPTARPLEECDYGDVTLAPGPAQTQFRQTQSVLLNVNEDSLLKPFRLRAGLPAPGPDLGGWYDEVPLLKTESGGHGFAPAHCFGQWISALARGYAADQDSRTKARLQRLLDLYEPTISGKFYQAFRFPAYNYDKLVIGLIDAHTFAQSPNALRLLELTTNAAEPHLPPHALDRDEPQRQWRQSVGDPTGNEYTWDESYTMPENLYLAWQRGAGDRYRTMASRFLLDQTYFDPLAENRNVLPGHHAYSFCNALSSAMQAYLADGSAKHLRAAGNAFDMIDSTQSFATGGWGPNESFVEPGQGKLGASLTDTHRGFETPCGSYAHFKLTRYLLRVKRDGRYGDSMERVLYNTVLGAKPLELDGHAFYYADYHTPGRKSYHPDRWPCCSGTLPQVAADYRKLIYFRDAEGLAVNLYLPSTLKWTTHEGAQFTLTQTGSYPIDSLIVMRLESKRPSTFALSLRIPGWSGRSGHSIKVNGRPIRAKVSQGFAKIERKWSGSDTLEIRVALPTRLQPVDPQHPETVALMRGPLVLFALTDDLSSATSEQLLAARSRPNDDAWQTQTSRGPLRFKPFVNLEDETYTTYLKTEKATS